MKIKSLVIYTTILSLIFHFSLLIFNANVVNGQASTNYKLKNYEFGGGGVVDSTSSNYSLEAILSELAAAQSSANYRADSGLIFTQQSNVPPAPTFVNDTGTRYNKLKITINQDSGDPSDTTYAIAISTDDFVTTNWVQPDNTIGSSLGIEDFQSYANWGGASGEFIIGLARNTTYKVKVKSRQGKYTESPLGPVASAATVDSQISFDIDIGGGSDPGETAPPYAVNVGSLTAGTPVTASNRVWLDLATNGEAGGYIYVYDQNAGLRSTDVDYTINSATANLASGAVTEGFGLQGASKTQSSGGPLDYVGPYDGTAENVGLVNTVIREIFDTSSSPIVGGRGSFSIKAKASNITPGANDYSDTLTVIAAASF